MVDSPIEPTTRELAHIRETVQALLATGQIEQSTTPWTVDALLYDSKSVPSCD